MIRRQGERYEFKAESVTGCFPGVVPDVGDHHLRWLLCLFRLQHGCRHDRYRKHAVAVPSKSLAAIQFGPDRSEDDLYVEGKREVLDVMKIGIDACACA